MAYGNKGGPSGNKGGPVGKASPNTKTPKGSVGNKKLSDSSMMF